MKAAQQSLDKKQKELKRAEKALQEVLSKVASLKLKYDESIAQKKALEDEARAAPNPRPARCGAHS